MATIPQVRELILWLLGEEANQLARSTGFTQRESKLTGSVFAQALVLSSLAHPAVTYPQLCQGALNAGVAISPQGLEQRFTPQAADFLEQLLEKAVAQVMIGQPAVIPLFQRFAGVVIRDSSVVGLPAALQARWPGVGGSSGETAALKLQVKLEETSGQVGGPVLQAGRRHDHHSPFQDEDLPAGTLRLADLGFFDLDQLVRDQARGVYWLTRYKTGTGVHDRSGHRLDLPVWLQGMTGSQFELPIQLGVKVHLPARLLVWRVPQEVADQRRHRLKEIARKKQQPISAEAWALAGWTILLTNVPVELLSLQEAWVMLRVRWQIECLFRVWKGQFQVDDWRSTKPYRILCELYAKLIGVVLFHWLVQIQFWALPDHSLWKAATVMHTFATPLALTLPDGVGLERILICIQASFLQICHLTPRRAVPNTYQRLLALTNEP